jgi:hypothetical protein
LNFLAFVKRALGFEQAPSVALAVRAALPQASGLSRRQFLTRTVTAIAGAAAASTLDLEQLLWLPGEKTIFIPKAVDVPFLNTFCSADWFTKEVLRMLKHQLQFATHINRQYADQFMLEGARIGDTVNVRRPVSFDPRPDTFLIGPIVENVQPVVLTDQYRVELDMRELRACPTVDAARTRFVRPTAQHLQRIIEHKHLDVFADLAIPAYGVGPTTVARSREAGLSLRGVQHYDIATDQELLSVDFLGGSSERRQMARRETRRFHPRPLVPKRRLA